MIATQSGKREGDDDRADSLGRDRRERVGDARAPVVSHNRDAVEAEGVEQVDRVGGQRDAASVSRGASGDLKRVAPVPRRLRPAVQQEQRPTVRRAGDTPGRRASVTKYDVATRMTV